jgi:hypothetical protein
MPNFIAHKRRSNDRLMSQSEASPRTRGPSLYLMDTEV